MVQVSKKAVVFVVFFSLFSGWAADATLISVLQAAQPFALLGSTEAGQSTCSSGMSGCSLVGSTSTFPLLCSLLSRPVMLLTVCVDSL